MFLNLLKMLNVIELFVLLIAILGVAYDISRDYFSSRITVPNI